jgi:hypothetical protein
MIADPFSHTNIGNLKAMVRSSSIEVKPVLQIRRILFGLASNSGLFLGMSHRDFFCDLPTFEQPLRGLLTPLILFFFAQTATSL